MTATHTDTETRKETRRSKVLLPIIFSLISLTPFALFSLPGTQKALAHVFDIGFSTDNLSYDPSGPMVLLESGMRSDASVLLTMLVTVVIAGVPGLILWGLLRLFAHRIDREFVIWAFLYVAVAGVATSLVAMKTVVAPHSEQAEAYEAESAHVTQWVEGRYGLDIDATTAESLVDEAHNGGDPVLIEGRLINLTRIAQGGYVLTDEKSGTELPTRN